jgi:acetyl-CoA carboxylase carboxyltransferase component
VYADKLRGAADPEAERQALVDAWSLETNPYGAAGIMNLDDVIDPADTRSVLVRAIERAAVPPPLPGHRKPLSYWPTCL